MKRTIALAVLAVLFFSCSAAKRNRHKSSPVTHERKRFYIDSIASKIEFSPEAGYRLFIENVQVYVVAKKQPAVGVTITPASGESQHHMLPQYSNAESFSFGGGVRYQLNAGDKGVVDIFDAASATPLKSRIIISGYEEN